MRPLCQRLQRQGFNGDGRTDRAPIQIVTRPTVRPYVTAGLETDAPRECVRPLRGWRVKAFFVPLWRIYLF